ncbi:MAG: hypothetical protein AAFX08_02980 [Pseudomonadota bacterium]
MLLRRRTFGRSTPSGRRDERRQALLGACAVIYAAGAGGALASDDPASARNALRDIQLGESDDRFRVAFICREACPIEEGRDGGFRLVGVSADIELDLSRRSRHAAALTLSAEGAASRIALAMSPEFAAAAVRACDANGETASCLDFVRADAPEVLTPPPLASGANEVADAAPEAGAGAASVIDAAFAPPGDLRADTEPPEAMTGAAGGWSFRMRIDEAANGPAPLDSPPLLIRAVQRRDVEALGRALEEVEFRSGDEFETAQLAAPETSSSSRSNIRAQAFLLRDDGARIAPLRVGRPRLGVAVSPITSTGERIGFSAPIAERFAPPSLLGAFEEEEPANDVEEAVAPAQEETVEAPRPQSALEAPSAVDPGARSTPDASSSTPDYGAAMFDGPPLSEGFDLGAEAATILGRVFDSEACEAAMARLAEDPWTFEAMIDVGVCQAVEGADDDADLTFERVLAHTPDNYEALVGRALVAAHRGSRSLASAYFQDALNALPPIEESNRIVDAMGRL